MKTIKEAQEKTIYFLDHSENNKIVTSSYYEYLLDFGQGDYPSSIDEVEKNFYVINGQEFESETEAEEYCEENELSIDLIEEITKTFYTHVVKYSSGKIKCKGWESEDLESVEAEFIKGLEWYISDKNQNAPEWFHSQPEANESRIELGAEAMGVDKDVFISIDRKQAIVEARRAELAKISNEKRITEDSLYFEKYKNIIEKIEGESYKECERRLSQALPEIISSNVFHKIVKSLIK